MSDPKKVAKKINGRKIADEILKDLVVKVGKMKKRPGLAAILIGDDAASKLYVKNKEKACIKVGINFHAYLCGKDSHKNITEDEIVQMIDFLNKDSDISGIIIQLPIPKKFNTQRIIKTLDPKKDVDGFHPKNYEKYLKGDDTLKPPLIASIVKIINEYDIDLDGKNVLIISNSKIFSNGLDFAIKKFGAHVSIVKSDAKDLIEKTKNADMIISIVGRPHFLKGSMIKKDAVIIDVGITLVKDEFLGDVDFASVENKASLVTPTPGGVGPLTVAMLLENTCKLAR